LALEVRVALLPPRERETRDRLFLGIVVDVDVVAREHAPLEIRVLDLVLAERHRLPRSRAAGERNERKREQRSTERHRYTSMERIGSSWMTRSAASIPATTRPKTVYPP